MLFIKLTGGPFLKDSLQSFEFLEHTSDFQTASTGVCWTSQVCVVSCYQRWNEWIRRFGQAQWLTSKRRRFILAYNSQPKFGQTFA